MVESRALPIIIDAGILACQTTRKTSTVRKPCVTKTQREAVRQECLLHVELLKQNRHIMTVYQTLAISNGSKPEANRAGNVDKSVDLENTTSI